jgi:hypothetical protein
MPDSEPDDDQGREKQDPLNHEEAQDFDDPHPYAAGINGILEAVANVIEKERFVEAISGWVDSRSQKVKTDAEKASVEERYRWRYYGVSVVFSLGIFLGLSVLAWNGKISPETAGTLFGALIGYWFGRQQKKGD